VRDLNDLHFFAAVVTHGGFSAAARALGVAKSRVSKRVAVLEAQLGVRLVERSTRRFCVTDAGRDLYERARLIVEQADEIERIAARLQAEPQGLVRISCPTNAVELIEGALRALLRRHPRLRLQLLVTNRRIDLIDERVDVAVRVREQLDTDGDLQIRIVGSARQCLVASPGFLASHEAPALPSDLGRLPTVAHHEALGPARWILRGPDERLETVEIEPCFAAGDFAMVLEAALDGIGVALLPEIHCAAALEAGRLVRVLPGWSTREGSLHLVFTSRRGMLPSVRVVIDCVTAALEAALVSAPGR